ncbi:hypothetical protein F2P81_003000 [Scophthalmus maximus]|uniref:Uncharacterized protein n=1 Tax=Scophthalmus maximus TaxID=52904 RepID=A0A6A4TPC4_SCOMX|nr:hypothetical protein F2P81_003000 [Scophthalmus maximus]
MFRKTLREFPSHAKLQQSSLGGTIRDELSSDMLEAPTVRDQHLSLRGNRCCIQVLARRVNRRCQHLHISIKKCINQW